MKIRVLTFGIVRDIAGADKIEVDLPEGSSVSDLQGQLQETYPALERLNALMVAVNTEYASQETILTQLDEVALIPPVSGG